MINGNFIASVENSSAFKAKLESIVLDTPYEFTAIINGYSKRYFILRTGTSPETITTSFYKDNPIYPVSNIVDTTKSTLIRTYQNDPSVVEDFNEDPIGRMALYIMIYIDALEYM